MQTGIPYSPSAKIKYALFHHELTMDRIADDEKRQALFAACKGKLDALERQIRALDELIPLADASFETDERCTGCGICVRICPVGNIKMVDNRPVWQHHCETCYACFQWCARKAIHGSIVEYEKRDHHPDVELAAMLEQASKVNRV